MSFRCTRPECRQCKSCLSRKTNLCTQIRATQGKGVMPDGTSRFSIGKEMIHHYMGCSTLLELHRAAGDCTGEDSRGRAVRQGLLYRLRCHDRHRCRRSIRRRSRLGANVVVFGLGGIGLNVDSRRARSAGANKIVGVDINPGRVQLAGGVRHDALRESERGRR